MITGVEASECEARPANEKLEGLLPRDFSKCNSGSQEKAPPPAPTQKREAVCQPSYNPKPLAQEHWGWMNE